MKVWYIDSTLRDGEQAPGVSFHPYEKINIAALLDDMGMDELELGTPAMGAEEIRVMKHIATAGFSFKTTSWCRALENDIQAAIKAKTNGINLSFPVSAIQLSAINKTENWIYARMPRLVSIAKDYFEYVAIGLQDASRADYNTLQKVITLAQDFNVSRIRIADTVGCLNPFSTQELFTRLCRDFPKMDFEFHGHNDLGMATANSLAAVSAGARSLSTTVNGLGERAGNTSIDEIVMALYYSENIKPHLKTKRFKETAEYVSKVSGRTIPCSKPITGKRIYQHESGIHTRSLIKNKDTYQLIDQTLTGEDDNLKVVFGKHSGVAALEELFIKQGISLNKETMSAILEQIKMQSSIRKDNLPEKDILELYYQLT
ncbi:MAG: pyruvate carboxyltransferase [Bacteroidales bacterium]|nr:pyruvate carboxyltransferase [Bacteroidales bacterium]MBN2817588.1 pyruvate carboxyltransferase [Bacteroidales bacterium]